MPSCCTILPADAVKVAELLLLQEEIMLWKLDVVVFELEMLFFLVQSDVVGVGNAVVGNSPKWCRNCWIGKCCCYS